MIMIISMTGYIHTTLVLGPSAPPTPDVVQQIIIHGKVGGATLPPSLIEGLCTTTSCLSALRSLEHVQYVGAPLNTKTGALLSPHTRLAPSIGSTEAGGYFVELRPDTQDWEYVSFQPLAGATFEHRHDNLHELVFVRREGDTSMQSIFLVYPDINRFETKDLWIEHPQRKGLWKIVGRADDYVYLASGEGLHASSMEPAIERLGFVGAALIGGHGLHQPVLLLELTPDGEAQSSSGEGWRYLRKDLVEKLGLAIEEANRLCHTSVRLSRERVLFASPEKPFLRTIKGTVARAQSLQLYAAEIDALDGKLRGVMKKG